MKKYAVIGNPIQHSLSPLIHQNFAQQLDIELSYDALNIICDNKEDLKEQLIQLCLQGYQGLSVTVPYKTWAFEIIQEKNGLSERAYQTGAVNTVSFVSSEKWLGDNTDGVGLIRDLKKNLHWTLENRNILLLGAGGAVRGVLPSLIAEFPASVDIVNRDGNKAKLLATKFNSAKCLIRGLNYIDLKKQYDIVINATSASLQQKLPSTIEGLTAKNTCFYDMVYIDFDKHSLTPFLKWAISNGAQASSNGIGMLLEQAAEAFFLWHQKMPDVSAAIANLTKT